MISVWLKPSVDQMDTCSYENKSTCTIVDLLYRASMYKKGIFLVKVYLFILAFILFYDFFTFSITAGFIIV